MATYRPDRGGGGNFSPVIVAYAADIVLDLSAATKPLFLIQLTGSANISAINGTDGQEFAVRTTQANGGGHSIAWDADFRGSSDTPVPSPSSGLGVTDYFGFLVNGDEGTYDHMAPNKGFA